MVKIIVRAVIGSFLVAIPQGNVLSQETTNYTYDALGRLVAVDVDGGPADTSGAEYSYDDAGNRTSLSTATGASGGTCNLQTFNASTSDEFSAYAQISPVGSCPVNVTLSYTITKQSGTGSWVDRGFTDGSSVLRPTDTYKLVHIDPTSYSIPAGQILVLRVNWSATSGNAAISPAHSTISIYSSH